MSGLAEGCNALQETKVVGEDECPGLVSSRFRILSTPKVRARARLREHLG